MSDKETLLSMGFDAERIDCECCLLLCDDCVAGT